MFWLDISIPPGDSSGAALELQCDDEVRLFLLECAKLKNLTGSRVAIPLTSPYRVMCLVLRSSATVDGAWEPIGLIHPADDTAVYLVFRDDLGADLGVDRSMVENPSSWFASKETLVIA